jgi:hypothetical protein
MELIKVAETGRATGNFDSELDSRLWSPNGIGIRSRRQIVGIGYRSETIRR